MKPALLFLSAHLPAVLSPQAGQKTAMRNLRWLAEKYAVELIAFRSEIEREEPLGELADICRRTHVADVDWPSRFIGAAQDPLAPFSVAARKSAAINRVIARWCQSVRYARVHIEWTQLGAYLPELLHIPDRTLYVHDVLEQWAARRAIGRRSRWIWLMEAARARRWEVRNLPKFTRIYTPSSKDCDLLVGRSPELAGRLDVLPLHFDRYRPVGPRNYNTPLSILFWGALGRDENANAARWICDQLLPRLKARAIKCRIVIAGSNPPEDVIARRASDLVVTGFIENPSSTFAEAHMAVLPLFEGAGVKVKLLECLASGLPCLTTPIGAEGIKASADDGLLVGEAVAERFADTIAALDSDRIRLRDLALRAETWGSRQQIDHRAMLMR